MRKSKTAVAKIFALALLVTLLQAVIAGWLFMLFLGAAHSHEAEIPAWGYWACFWIAAAIDVASFDTKK